MLFEYFFQNLSRKFKFYSNLTGIMGTSHENLCAFMIISRLLLLRIAICQTKLDHISCKVNHFFNHAVCEIILQSGAGHR